MRCVPLVEILLLSCRRPTIQRVALRLRARILRSDGERVAVDHHGGFFAVEDGLIARRVVLIAVQAQRCTRIIVERRQQVWIISPVFEMGEAADGTGAAGSGVDAADALNAREQVDEQVASHALSIPVSYTHLTLPTIY